MSTINQYPLCVIIYFTTILTALILDIYVFYLSIKKKSKESIFNFCIFHIIFSNLCHIFCYTLNFFQSSPSNSKMCIIQATLINSLPVSTDFFILSLSITLFSSMICNVDFSKSSKIIKNIIMIILYIFPIILFKLFINHKEGKSGFNEVFCYSSDDSINEDKRKVIILGYGLRISVIVITLCAFVIFYIYIKKIKAKLSSIKIFFIEFIQIFFGLFPISIRVWQFFHFETYEPKAKEMWIICFSYSLAGICYPLVFAYISGLFRKEKKEKSSLAATDTSFFGEDSIINYLD